MKVNEMVFFDALRNIEKRLGKAYFHATLPMSPIKAGEDCKKRLNKHWDSLDAVKEAQEDLELLLTLIAEDPREIALQSLYARNKAELYKILEVNPPMTGSPIGIAVGQPVTVKKSEDE